MPTVTRAALRAPDTFGETVRDARVRANISLRDLAKRLQVAPSYLSDIELDRRTPSTPVIQWLATVLRLDVDDLIARAGRLSEETMLYLRQHPSAGALLRLIASQRLSDEALRTLLEHVERMGRP